MTDTSPLLTEVVLWGLLAVTIGVVHTRTHKQSVGLVVAYITNLWLIHWPATVTYLFPWYLPIDTAEVMAGFRQSLVAVFGLGIGVLAIGPFVVKALEPPRAHSPQAATRQPNAALPYIYLLIGVLSYFVATPLFGRVATIAAITVGVNQLIVVGFCLVLWHAWYAKQTRRFIFALIGACVIPLMTILREGFLSYGAMAIIAILSFMAVFVRPRWALAGIGVIVAYVAFSFYVTYMRDRGELRAAVWGGESVMVRVTSLSKSVTTLEWFDPYNPQHLVRVNGRLNQNYLVGAAVRNLEQGEREYAYGQTVLEAFSGLIPRALWPNKPTQAGSGDLVTRFTGITFVESTSVGIGQVMEFYVNFGTVGVFIGFILFGAALTMLDAWAAERLWNGDWLQFAVWFLGGLAMMQAGGSLVDVLSSAGAAVLGVLFVNRYIAHMRAGPRYAPLTPSGR